MTRVVCIVGLPGSGKTFQANKMAREMQETCLVIDDIKTTDDLPERDEYDCLIITDPYFCDAAVRGNAFGILLNLYLNVEWIYFENSPEKCLQNVKHRDDGRKVEGLIKLLSPKYHPAPNAVPIWTNND